MLPPRKVHVLFVHGVGKHSPLSSLLQAYQGIRSNLRSNEAPITFEDPIPGWRLSEFVDTGSPAYLRLEPSYKGGEMGPSEAVYFYEVNYSSLAGVIRANQPLDITHLFVGLDLAITVALSRLHSSPNRSQLLEHLSVAHHAGALSEVAVAATIPILGLPSRLLGAYTKTFIATFNRFFEDVATFALDKNGEELISKHIDRTVQSIVSNDKLFSPPDNRVADDVFVIAAHSLGTVVTHNYLVRHWSIGGRYVPSKLLTFGSPIGIVCWMWLLLDFHDFDFSKRVDDFYFCWTPESLKTAACASVAWTNVINYLDPLATAFPTTFIDLSRNGDEIATSLTGGCPKHVFGGSSQLGSIFSAHTSYFDDRRGFIEVLTQIAGLRPEEPALVMQRSASEHRTRTVQGLRILRWLFWSIGMIFILVMLGAIAYAAGSLAPFLLSPLFVFPCITLGFLAFFQRLIYGGPTKRTSLERIGSLSWTNIRAVPFLIRKWVGVDQSDPDPLSRGRGRIAAFLLAVVSFLPTLSIVELPVYFASYVADKPIGAVAFSIEHPGILAISVLAFALYVLSFAASEIVANWRRIVLVFKQS